MKMKAKKKDIKSEIIKRQSDEIESLKKSIEDLNMTCEQKDAIINAIDGFRNDLIEVLQDLDDKRNRYGELINELTEMKRVMNKEVFKGRWNLVRFLLK